ncbi:adhesion G protein-coupled receptor L3-like [Anneissia japonica]|uniref:adhesion G protein-coupled receptor L3-like n=1 Tax=Anneissia japonica TaxID=1529436 RepID=UPI00142558ED|nr:adhesion G protein-coupled receptor L3-like [Anneissia japonica]
MASLSAIIPLTVKSWQLVITIATLVIFQVAAVPNRVDLSKGVPQQRIKRNPGAGLVYYSSVCDGSTMDLRCPKGYVLDIDQANYGRTDTKTCILAGTPETNDQCFWMPYSFDVVSKRCDNKSYCSIIANVSTFGGDPCPETRKYLEVTMRCIENPATAQLTTAVPSTTPDRPHNLKTRTTILPLGETTVIFDDNDDDQLTMGVETSTSRTTTKTPSTEGKVIGYVTDRVTGPIKIDLCPEVVQRGITWKETASSSFIVEAPCPEGSTGTARWACVGQPARWFPESGPDLSNCVSPWVNNITKMVEKGESSNEVTAALAEVTNQVPELYGGDVVEVVNILSTSVEKTKIEIESYTSIEQKTAYSTQVTENFISTGSNMLADKRKSSWQDLPKGEKTDTATSLLSSIEQSAFLMANTFQEERSFYGEGENVLMEVVVHEMKKATYDLQFPNTPGFAKKWNNIQDSITISSTSIEDKQQDGKVKLVFFAYNNMEELLGVSQKAKGPLVSKKFVNSRVISLSVNDPLKQAPLKEPVRMIFNHLETNGTSDPTCSFWKFANSTHGEWANEGCQVEHSNSTHTECICNHLTNFAIIMDVKGVEISDEHTFALSTITYAGFTISITCLLMAFITFTAFKNLQNDRNTIHKNLCLCLLVAEFVFLIGIDRGDFPAVCTVVAVLLHYFFLASFAWMCLEGIQLYVMLVEVFEAESSRRKYYYPFGYGVPLITVAVAALVNYEGYGTESHCWLQVENHFIWSFIGPICIVIMVNTVFLTMAFVIMCRHSTIATNKRQKTTKEKLTSTEKIVVGTDRLEYIMSWVRGSFVLLCILGITWIFGLLYVSDSTVLFAYIFTIFNSVQGVFIFVFHCLMNDKVKKEYRRFVRNNSWMPMCVRVQFGGVSSSQSNQQASYRSSSTSAKLRNMWDNRRYSDSTSVDKRKSNTSLNKGSFGEAPNRFSMSVESPSSETPMIREGEEFVSDVFIKEPQEDPAPLALDENSVVDDSIADHLGWRIRENPLSLSDVKEEEDIQKTSNDANVTETTHLEDDSKEEQSESKPLINVYVNGIAEAQENRKNNDLVSEINKNKVNQHSNDVGNTSNDDRSEMFSTPNVYVITEDTDELEEKDRGMQSVTTTSEHYDTSCMSDEDIVEDL